jgi:hypothetical protein
MMAICGAQGKDEDKAYLYNMILQSQNRIQVEN